MIKPKVLFLYSENSCFSHKWRKRFLRDMAGDRFEAMCAEWKQPHWTLRR